MIRIVVDVFALVGCVIHFIQLKVIERWACLFTIIHRISSTIDGRQ